MPQPIKVTITQEEFDRAIELGALRHHTNVQQGLTSKAGFKGDNIAIHELGALGELVASKWLGVPYPHSRSLERGGPDIIGNYEVRTTFKVMAGELKIYPDEMFDIDDNNNRIYILVSSGPSHLSWYVEGWVQGSFARAKAVLEYRDKREPAYFVYRSDLMSMEILPGRHHFDQSGFRLQEIPSTAGGAEVPQASVDQVTSETGPDPHSDNTASDTSVDLPI